jgi:thiopurine S-methyltransferase
MNKDFWLDKWQGQVLGFHLEKPNPLLVDHIECLSLPEGSRLFLPLCGKTLDIGWLLDHGYAVAGCELSEVAVVALFAALELEPLVSRLGDGLVYSASNIDIFVDDFFNLSGESLHEIAGDVDAIYDRAALIALPAEMRERYAAHLLAMTKAVPQLLVTIVYDQMQLPGPPFSVSDGAVQQYYADSHELELLASSDIPGGLKGQCPAIENVWLLS